MFNTEKLFFLLKIWQHHMQFLTQWMRESEGGEVWDRKSWVRVQDLRRSRAWWSEVLGPAHEFSQLRLILPLHVGTHSWPTLPGPEIYKCSSRIFSFLFFSFFPPSFCLWNKAEIVKKNPSDANFCRCCAGTWGHEASVLLFYSEVEVVLEKVPL